MDMKQFLNEVAIGGKGLQPRGSTVDDLAAFQPVVEAALEAERLGYVERVVTHKESYTGHRFFSVLIVGALTEAGREAIAAP